LVIVFPVTSMEGVPQGSRADADPAAQHPPLQGRQDQQQQDRQGAEGGVAATACVGQAPGLGLQLGEQPAGGAAAGFCPNDGRHVLAEPDQEANKEEVEEVEEEEEEGDEESEDERMALRQFGIHQALPLGDEEGEGDNGRNETVDWAQGTRSVALLPFWHARQQ
jgi:hypothetical protein